MPINLPPRKAKSDTPRGLKWCKRCGRKHASNAVCNQYLRTRTTKSGKTMKVWAA